MKSATHPVVLSNSVATHLFEAVESDVQIPVGRVTLDGILTVPSDSWAVVIFAHGTGSSRHSPRNRKIALLLQRAGIATLLFDLLTKAEERLDSVTELRFNIDLLAQRLLSATDWLARQPRVGELNIGYFGASTGAAAALEAAAQAADRVGAVVSRGGRPDLAGQFLPLVQSPTLLIVGENDPFVLDLNRQALNELNCERRLKIVAGATHLFEEPGALEEVARLAREWFERYFRRRHDQVPAA
jgi:putative phosphoribosyl transferase